MSIALRINPSSKEVWIEDEYLETLNPEKQTELLDSVQRLNELHRQVINLNGGVPPPPDQVSKNVSEQIAKLKATADSNVKTAKYEDALKHYNLAVDMALRRPPWERVMLLMQELVILLGPRADTFMMLNRYPEAYTDVLMLCLLQPDEPLNHYRKGRCLKQINKLAEAADSFKTASLKDKKYLKDYEEVMSMMK